MVEVINGLAFAPPALGCIIGVSTPKSILFKNLLNTGDGFYSVG